MQKRKLALLHEDTSPLHRIMTSYELSSGKRQFSNNIAAFHAGNGIVISVAHNLRLIDELPTILSKPYIEHEIKPKLNRNQLSTINTHYNRSFQANIKELSSQDSNSNEKIRELFNSESVDRRYSNLYKYGCCKPMLVLSFKSEAFFGRKNFERQFKSMLFYEEEINRYTFLIELELLDIYINNDIAVYKMKNTSRDIINSIPFLKINYDLFEFSAKHCYCLQPAPFDFLGRSLTKSNLDGFVDTFNLEYDNAGNKYIIDGLRYMFNGYFRFGSSGSPYVAYNEKNSCFEAFAIQSQACFTEIELNGNKANNKNYNRGLATPFKNLENEIKNHLSKNN